MFRPRCPSEGLGRQLGSARFRGDSKRGRYERGARDDEAEREDPRRDSQRPRPDRIAKNEDAPDDRDEVGGYGRQCDHFDARTNLETARGGVERDD